MIDLHSHSTASDGTDTPQELIGNAVAAGVTTLALTDHDTTGGWAEAEQALADAGAGFTLIRGTEFSARYDAPSGERTNLHLLGYLFDPAAEGLRAERAALRDSRLHRGEAMVDALVAGGYPISWQQVLTIADGGSVGRPHIAQALQQAGIVGSTDEAFATLLSDSSPYHVPKKDLPVMRAIELIREAGGVPVIAHPWARRRGDIVDETALRAMVDAGMLGIEVDHVDHAPADRQRLTELAADLDVFTTGSSDYHGTHKAVRLGAEQTHPDALARLLELATGSAAVTS
jgi:predicted metal-dependent phosphoesterase TrpH